MSVMLTLKYFG